MLDIVRNYDGKPVTEVHIVGGVHPRMDIHFFAGLLYRFSPTKMLENGRLNHPLYWKMQRKGKVR